MDVILAPSNLGLCPLRPGHEPGAWRAPQVLLEKGLFQAVRGDRLTPMKRPPWSAMPQPGTRLYNGRAMRAFNLDLADEVALPVSKGRFALVVGGDCSVLLGALAGARRSGPLALVHLDGHSDFRHPGNYDPAAQLGAVAGMDLALATGRGEPLMTDWPGVASPLVPDERVIQVGEREGRDPDFAWPDVRDTAITRIEIFEALEMGVSAVSDRIGAHLDAQPDNRFWVHLDVDVLDQSVMPAVDSPGSPGFDFDQLAALVRPLVKRPGCLGMTLTVFDPDLDPDGALAEGLVQMLGTVFEPG